MLKVKRLHENATLPKRGSPMAAGLDLYACESGIIYSGAQVKIPTGIAVAIPPGFYGRVAPRSGLAVNYGINVHAGVVDSDYRGELHVCLINHGERPFEYKAGERIAQLIIEQCLLIEPVEVDDLESTERGAGGFGSTGR